jgi:hypothetical protein
MKPYLDAMLWIYYFEGHATFGPPWRPSARKSVRLKHAKMHLKSTSKRPFADCRMQPTPRSALGDRYSRVLIPSAFILR